MSNAIATCTTTASVTVTNETCMVFPDMTPAAVFATSPKGIMHHKIWPCRSWTRGLTGNRCWDGIPKGGTGSTREYLNQAGMPCRSFGPYAGLNLNRHLCPDWDWPLHWIVSDGEISWCAPYDVCL